MKLEDITVKELAKILGIDRTLAWRKYKGQVQLTLTDRQKIVRELDLDDEQALKLFKNGL